MSRFDMISALEGLIKARGIRLRDVVVVTVLVGCHVPTGKAEAKS
jgi:hypothetical protein